MRERGSALVVAIFVMALLTSLGVALLALSQLELQMARADVQAKEAFYIAEAGLEHARDTLIAADAASESSGSLDDELDDSAGDNGEFDFDVTTVRPLHDAAGRVTGFTGYGDDMPVQSFTSFAGGGYIAFLRNDGIDDAVDSLDDTNNRVVLTAVGAGSGSSVEVVEAVVQRNSFPSLPATITLLGPDPVFTGGDSKVKRLVGDDCDGEGLPGLYVPVVGLIGASAKTDAEDGVDQPTTYRSGSDTGVDTVSDVESSIHPVWNDCDYLLGLASQIRGNAALVGDSSTSNSSLGEPGSSTVVFIDDDYTLNPGFSGGGLLWVTGTLTLSGNVSWDGPIFVVGEGVFQRNGAGGGTMSGGFLVANVAGNDGIFGTADDCAGDDGSAGTADDDIQSSEWSTSGGGGGDVIYCSEDVDRALVADFIVSQFRQR